MSERTDQPRPLAGRVAIVTGAASGIGLAIARALGATGATVAMVDRAEGEVTLAAKESTAHHGSRAEPFVADLSSTDQTSSVVPAVLESLGDIDILVNAAGTMGPSPGLLLELDPSSWDDVYALNVRAPFVLSQHVAQNMVGRGRGGRIVNITSSGAHRPHSPAAYGSSKAALGGLTRISAGELAPHDINVNAVAPGLTATPMAKAVYPGPGALEDAVRQGPLANLLGRVSEPEDVANVVVFLCLPESRQITGQTIHTSAGSVV